MHYRTHSPLPLLRLATPAALVTAALVGVACSSSSEPAKSPAEAQTKLNDALGRLDDAASTVKDLRGQIPDDAAARARCLVVVPAMKKGGLLVGGQSGQGFAECQTPHGWSGPAPVVVSGGTFGAQAGYQESQVVAILTTDKARRKLETGSLKIGVDASAAAGPVGVGRGTQFTDAEVLSYSKASGLFAGATLDGTSVNADIETTNALYGTNVYMSSILEGQVPPPPRSEVERFMTALRTAFPPTPEVAQSSN
ncbi:MAG TPA: lipid-binding SYLF domain-containing protein [Polyangiaceae bacterium]|nr:lipid-binding SYLF domain-containing protein [Polyangiaceae bacterium]